MVDFLDCLKLPLKYKTRLMYFYLSLIPILGQLLVFGYFVRLNKHLIEGNKDGFPYLGSIKQNIISGFKFFIMNILVLLTMFLFLLIIYSLGLLLNNTFAIVLLIIFSIAIIFILPLVYIRYFEVETFSILLDLKFLFKFLTQNVSSYTIHFLKDILSKILYLFFPVLFFIGVFYFYNIIFPTGYDLASLIICIVGGLFSLIIFLPVFFLSFFTTYSMYYNENTKED